MWSKQKKGRRGGGKLRGKPIGEPIALSVRPAFSEGSLPDGRHTAKATGPRGGIVWSET